MSTTILSKAYKLRKIHSIVEGKLRGAMSPFMAGEAIAKEMDLPMLGIYRLSHNNRMVYQSHDPYPDFTGYDHLILITPHLNIFFVDRGTDLVRIAAIFVKDKEMMFSTGNGGYEPKWVASMAEDEITAMMESTLPLTAKCITEIKADRESRK